MKRVRRAIGVAAWATIIGSVIAAGADTRSARAQEQAWPTRPLTLVVPFSAGGSSDVIARIIA
jgi:tripartite-type tricarboxylate transporter receptor subunit TctC